jgi:hypothetical protein
MSYFMLRFGSKAWRHSAVADQGASYAEDIRATIESNEKSLRACLAIAQRTEIPGLQRHIQQLRDVNDRMNDPMNYSKCGTIFAAGARDMSTEEVLDVIFEVLSRRIDGIIRRRFALYGE